TTVAVASCDPSSAFADCNCGSAKPAWPEHASRWWPGTGQYLDCSGEDMNLRPRLLLLFALTVLVPVSIVAAIVLFRARRAFDRTNNEQTSALVAQFTQEFTRHQRRGLFVIRSIECSSRGE